MLTASSKTTLLKLDFPGWKVGGTSSLQFNLAALFIDNDWKLRVTLFFGVINKLQSRRCVISTSTRLVLWIHSKTIKYVVVISWYCLTARLTTAMLETWIWRRSYLQIPTSEFKSTPQWLTSGVLNACCNGGECAPLTQSGCQESLHALLCKSNISFQLKFHLTSKYF